jgi:hypothetical protein
MINEVKLKNMHAIRFDQLKYECYSWERILTFYTLENIHQKNRLSEILKKKISADFLIEIEEYHSKFIRNDEFIYSFKHDLGILVRNINLAEENNLEMNAIIDYQITDIRIHIAVFVQEFNSIQQQFNKCLYDYIC